MQIHYVTTNRAKFQEAALILQNQAIELVHSPVELVEPQGIHADIASFKANEAYKALKAPILIDDVAFYCNALGGLPGPYIRPFLEAIQDTGLAELLAKYDDTNCSVACIIAYMDHTLTTPKLFEGVCTGNVVMPRGTLRFGKYSWNTIFQPHGSSKTYGELSMEEQSMISPRHKALTQLKSYLENSKIS